MVLFFSICSTSGCPYGELCHFQHFDSASQGHLAGSLARSPSLQGPKKRALLLHLLDPSLHVKGYKTKLCHNYKFTTGPAAFQGCKYGEHCHFAHSKAELRSKTTIANDAHDSRLSSNFPTSSKGELVAACLQHASPISNINNGLFNHCKPMDNWSCSIHYGEASPPGVPPPCCDANLATIDDKPHQEVATSISIDAAMAGFIIGRAGNNVKQISKLTGCRLSIKDHHSQKVRFVEMEGLPHQVSGAQEILRLLLETRKGSSEIKSEL
ncbi:hypothetical protein L7F22_063719 [Adiantum nelumboides]|nr:hypothetical protein [Adiantum nelumboides]